jgi:DNA-binding transcriptional ArsR family regulator
VVNSGFPKRASQAVQEPAGLDPLFQCLANPTRRAIVARLRAGPQSVGELAEPFPMSLPAVWKHISLLEAAGLISKARHGPSQLCTLNSARLRDIESWLEGYRGFWDATLDSLSDYIAAESQ